MSSSDTSGSGIVGFLALAAFVLMPIAILGPNTLLAFYAIIALIVGCLLLFRPGEPPILLLIFIYQWVQASISLFYGNLMGMPADSWAENGGQHERAIFLLLTGLILLALSIRLMIGSVQQALGDRILATAAAFPVSRWFRLFLIAWIFGQICLALSSLSDGLRQPLLFLGQLKWAPYLALTIASFGIANQSKKLWAVAFAIELVTSVGGYFSNFSEVLFYTLIGLATNRRSFQPRLVLPLAVFGAFTLLIAVVWVGVKKEYRNYLNEGTREQVVNVGYADRMARLQELVLNTDGTALREDFDMFVQRLSYFEFFGLVLDRVPSGTPHTQGEFWGGALIYPLMPRLFFPEKPKLDDTALTMKYTGIYQPAWLTGASVSLGYMTEAYIDFGPILMFAAIGALGLAIGGLYRYLMGRGGQKSLVGVLLTPVALMPQHLLESSVFKVIPPLILAYISSWFILNHLGPRLFAFLGSSGPAAAPHRY